MGIEFKLNTEIGKDIAFEDLLRDYDAVFLGKKLPRKANPSSSIMTPKFLVIRPVGSPTKG